jgi:hypothetical protein
MLDFDVAPFYDDSAVPGGAIDNNYMRILFKPGYAVQSRELTALQSILQNQITSLGSFVFQEGSPVSGGHISIDTTVWAVQLQSQYANTDISLGDFLVNGDPTLIFNSYGNVKAVVVATDSTQQNPTIIVKYLTAAQFSNTDTIQVATGFQTQAYVYNSNTYTNRASTASINDGIFYSGGFFVQVPAQTICLDSTTNNPSYFVGLSISENIVDEITDTALLDPAQGSFNYQGPGADRYQYTLTLDKRVPISSDLSAFFSLLTVTNGLITQQIDYPVFADLDKALAQRTYDTSGDFTVHPFVVTTQTNPANCSQYNLVVEPGKAYVKGFEFETIGTQKIASPRARTTNTVTDYGMTLNFGNYFIGQNVYAGNISGIFDVTNFQSIDFHTITSSNINTFSQATYAQTVIGTARVRDIEFLGQGSYYVYVTDMKMAPQNFIATMGGTNYVGNNGGVLANTLHVAQQIYANATISVTTNGVTDIRTVSATNMSAGNTKLTVSRNFTIPAGPGSNVTILWGVKDIGGGTVTPNTFSSNAAAMNAFYTQNTTAGDYACFDIGVNGMTACGNTILFDTQYNKMIFPLPQNYVAQNTIINASWARRKSLFSQTFAGGSLVISSGSLLGTGESLPFNYSGAVPAAVANANIFVFVRNNTGGASLANGQQVIWDGVFNTVTQTTSSSITLSIASGGTFVGDVILTVDVSDSLNSSIGRRTKTLVGNSAQTYLQAGATYGIASQVIGSAPASTVYIDTANGYVWFTSNAAMAMSPGTKQSLYVPDVFNILAILDSGNTNWAPANANVANDKNIISNYYLDSGQKDNYYDFSKLILKAGANPPQGQTVVICEYFQPDTIAAPVQGFFDCDSYSANVYANGIIPYYSSSVYGTISLRDSIDFRPVRNIGTAQNVNSFNLSGTMCPYPEGSMFLTFGYYLPRVDKLMLSKDKVFRVSQGVPAQYPVAPPDADDAMTLYVITLPAYTPNVQQISLQYIDHKRYTMQDIGFLDRRIDALELQSSLNALEKLTTEETVLYQDGVTVKDTYGILTDDFSDFSVCDNQNNDLRCYMAQNSLTPYKDQISFSLQLQSNSGSYYQSGKCYTLPFTEVPAVVQNTATSYTNIQPFLFGQFKGRTRLTPETTSKYSHRIAPQIIVPPSSTGPEQPPAPLPASAPAIAAAACVPQATTIVGSNQNTVDYVPYWDYWYYRGNQSFYYRVYRFATGYGAVSPFYNWHGSTTVTTTTNKTATIIPNSGSAIQLQAGTAAQTASFAISTRGRLHLFGNK